MLQRLRNIKRKEDSQIIIENLALCFLFSLGSGRDQLVCDEIEGASSAKSLSAIENSALASLLGSPTTDMDVLYLQSCIVRFSVSKIYVVTEQ